ncbi:MAG: antibiotic biosynthesis monooxygenase [Desulfobacterales bacterium]|nr:antibiotic biosynthesis monooxygenase [Desulfobacterales bacterium]
MAIKVFIKRKVLPDKTESLFPLLIKIRNLAFRQPGYISGETLKRIDHPGHYLVISTWQSFENWRAWILSDERTEVQDEIDDLLGEKTEYEVYQYH